MMEKGGKNINPSLEKIIANLKQARNHEERSSVREQVYELGSACAPGLIPHLNDKDDFVRWDVVSFLGEFAHADTLDAVVQFAISEREVHARWRSFWAVTRFDREKVTNKLLHALKSRNNSKRWNAALMLNMINHKAALPEIRKGLKADSEWIVWEALSALKAYGLPGTEEDIKPFIKKTNPRDIRQEAVLALGRIGTPKALTILKRAFKDPSHHVRWRVAFSMSMISHPDVLKTLEKQISIEQHQEVIRQLQEDISTIRKQHNHGLTKKHQPHD